jgi:alpha-D-ribose 1-methylphosphonate 5-triphosphate synthase subunit PhnI
VIWDLNLHPSRYEPTTLSTIPKANTMFILRRSVKRYISAKFKIVEIVVFVLVIFSYLYRFVSSRLSAHGNCPHGHARAPFLARRPRRNLVPLGREGKVLKEVSEWTHNTFQYFRLGLRRLDYGQTGKSIR